MFARRGVRDGSDETGGGETTEGVQRGFFTVSARDKDDLRAAGNGDREKRTDSVYILDRELKWIEEGCRG